MKASNGFDQCYNAQAAVDTRSMLIVATLVTQAGSDSRQIAPMLAALERQREDVGQPTHLLADTGYLSAANVEACTQAGITPLIAMKRTAHHDPVFNRYAERPLLAENADAVVTMAHLLTTPEGAPTMRRANKPSNRCWGIVKHAMKFRQFLARGVKQVGHEWNLVALAYDLKPMGALNMV
jgi:hypothetical protein